VRETELDAVVGGQRLLTAARASRAPEQGPLLVELSAPSLNGLSDHLAELLTLTTTLAIWPRLSG
jgi:hypothetical protein